MNYYDARETRAPAEREAEILGRLPAFLALARERAPAYAESLAGIDLSTITSRAALATLPVIRKSELTALQRQRRPFGGLATLGWGRQCARVFASPGHLRARGSTPGLLAHGPGLPCGGVPGRGSGA